MRVKPLVLVGTAVAGAAALLAGSQTWISFMLDRAHLLETASGHEINAALSPVSIALIAAALALAIAGPIFRRILGVLIALLGAGVSALAVSVLADPLGSLSGKITELTGIAGESGESAVIWSEVSIWGYIAVAAGLVAVAFGVITLVTASRWRAGGRKYEAGRADPAARAPDRISDWDALSDGDDPSDSDDQASNIR